MSLKEMWSANATSLAMLIAVNLVLAMAGEKLWIIADVVAILGAAFFNFRSGAALGHAACSVSDTIEAAKRAGESVYAQLDDKYLARGWSPVHGIKGLLASALIPYAAGCAYIIIYLFSRGGDGQGVPLIASRTAAWLLSLPWWPFIMHWHENFVALTPLIAGMLLITPFLLPLCTYVGYLQGPKLWHRSEEVMKQGLRRAKARSRVGKKLIPKNKGPEI